MIDLTQKTTPSIRQIASSFAVVWAALGYDTASAAEDRSAYFTQIPKDGSPVIFAKDSDEVCERIPYIDVDTGTYKTGTSESNTGCIGKQDVKPNCTKQGDTNCYITRGGNLVAILETEIPTKLRFGEVINGIRGGALPNITPDWIYQTPTNTTEVPYYEETTTHTKWKKSLDDFCTPPWTAPTRSDFNLAALVGGFSEVKDNDRNDQPGLLQLDTVYSDGTPSAHQILQASPANIAEYPNTNTSPAPAKLCVATSAISAPYYWNSAGVSSDYWLFQIKPVGQTKTTIFAVSSGATTPCNQINWPTPQDAVPFRAATIADLQFAINTYGVGASNRTSDGKPLDYGTGYITADTVKKYKFTAAAEPVEAVNETATQTICVQHTDQAASGGGSGGGPSG